MMTFVMYPREGKVLEMALLLNTNPKLWFAPDIFINYIFKIVEF